VMEVHPLEGGILSSRPMRWLLRLRHLPCLCRSGMEGQAAGAEREEIGMLDGAFEVTEDSRLAVS